MARTLKEQYRSARRAGDAARADDIKWKMRANRIAGVHDAVGSGIRTVKFAITGQRERAARAAGFFRENVRVIRTGSPARAGGGRSGRAASDASKV